MEEHTIVLNGSAMIESGSTIHYTQWNGKSPELYYYGDKRLFVVINKMKKTMNDVNGLGGKGLYFFL